VDGGGVLIVAIDAIARETTLFAAIWFLVGGIDDLLIDVIFAVRLTATRFRSTPLQPCVADENASPRIAIYVAAWDESAVIGAMLRTALSRFDYGAYRIYVGVYPNDRATIDAAAAVAQTDPRLRIVIGNLPGPTTKAGCLNTIWRAMLRDEEAGLPLRRGDAA
jgi:adsorption protein B